MTSRLMGARRPTILHLGSVAVPSTSPQPDLLPAVWFLDEDDEASRGSSTYHSSLECRMCGKHLGRDFDIYMYRGDTPFCSEECRDEQIQIDQLEERANRMRRRRRAAGFSSGASSSAQVKALTAAVRVGAV